MNPEYNIAVFKGKLLDGSSTKKLPQEKKLAIATQVSTLLGQHKKHMLQFTTDQLVENFMDSGSAVLCLDDHDELLGFAKISLWNGLNDQMQLVYEFGSWVVEPKHSNSGYGHQLAILATQTAKEIDPNCQLIAVCAGDNEKAINILLELGASEAVKPSNVDILLDEGQAQVVILDMSNLKIK